MRTAMARMKLCCGLILAAVVVAALMACRDGSPSPVRDGAAASSAVDSDFRFQGDVIHPGCLWELATCIADTLPCATAVDIEGCQQSNRYRERPTLEGDFVRWADPDGGLFFWYRHLGMLPNGVYVVLTVFSGGGSGAFPHLRFVRAVESRVYDQGEHRNRTLLKCVGSFGLGDGDDGSIQIQGNCVLVGKSKYRDKDVVLDLSEL